MQLVIFVVGLLVAGSVCFALFAYTASEMRPKK